MKHLALLVLILLVRGASNAQSVYSSTFSGLEIAPCPFNPNKITQQIRGWILYQTLNGNWDGPVDSSRCISAENNVAVCATFVRLSQIDPARPLFLRAKPEALQGVNNQLVPNKLYEAFAYVSLSPGNLERLQTDTGCLQDLCTGLFLGIAIPGPDGQTGAATRFHTGLLQLENAFYSNYWMQSCFPSEKFDQQSLRELVLKFSFSPSANWSAQILKLHHLSIKPVFFDLGLIDHVHAAPQHLMGSEYTVNLAEAADQFSQNFLMVYTAPTYPSAQAPAYVEARPEPNTNAPKTINLSVEPGQSLQIQPFTYLRGALVQGSDSVRHRANLLNNGGDFCINGLDLVFSKGSEYRHAGGHLSMNNAFSCLQFREQSALRVMENATLHYGNDGTGMLALCAGSRLVLEKNAVFVMDGVLNIAECDQPHTEPTITVDLHPGATLAFTPKAVLTNQFSKGQQLRLRVRMLGGSIDDSALDPSEQNRIERVYPEPAVDFIQNIALFPNPLEDQATLQYVANDTENLDLQWFDLNGRWASSQKIAATKGINQHPLQIPEKPGVYLLKIGNQRQRAVVKVVKMGQ